MVLAVAVKASVFSYETFIEDKVPRFLTSLRCVRNDRRGGCAKVSSGGRDCP